MLIMILQQRKLYKLRRLFIALALHLIKLFLSKRHGFILFGGKFNSCPLIHCPYHEHLIILLFGFPADRPALNSNYYQHNNNNYAVH